jgi:hypothetical protein
MKSLEGNQTANTSGFLNPLIEQIINELPTAHPSFLSTGTINDLKSLKLATQNYSYKNIKKGVNNNNLNNLNHLNLTMTSEALLAASNRNAAKSQLGVKLNSSYGKAQQQLIKLQTKRP